jgi:hypothetical protein
MWPDVARYKNFKQPYLFMATNWKTKLISLFGENLPEDSQENTVILEPLCYYAHFEFVMGTRCWLEAQNGSIKRDFGVEVNVPRKWSLKKVGCCWEGLTSPGEKIVVANFSNRISMQIMRSARHEVKGPSNFVVVGGFFFSSCVCCRDWTVHCSHYTWTVDGRLAMQAFFF